MKSANQETPGGHCTGESKGMAKGRSSEVTEAVQGQIGSDFSYEGERKQLQSLGREST